mmetsp:Transcript_18862/g.34172  ORF Transcript_18862/g.34172 Transcript_18862/m.34172 type:complete len:205 (-) Transcript_18862:392-1006(-)
MLIMVTHIECKPVEGSIVTIRFLPLVHHIVLGNEVTSDGVHSHTSQSPKYKVEKASNPIKVQNCSIERKKETIVHKLPFRRFLWIYNNGAERVEKRLHQAPQELFGLGGKEPPLKVCGNIYVNNVFTLITVVLHVVSFEGGCGRNSHGKIGKNGEKPVPNDLLRTQVVRQLVHRQRHHMVDTSRQGITAKCPSVPRRSLQELER